MERFNCIEIGFYQKPPEQWIYININLANDTWFFDQYRIETIGL